MAEMTAYFAELHRLSLFYDGRIPDEAREKLRRMFDHNLNSSDGLASSDQDFENGSSSSDLKNHNKKGIL